MNEVIESHAYLHPPLHHSRKHPPEADAHSHPHRHEPNAKHGHDQDAKLDHAHIHGTYDHHPVDPAVSSRPAEPDHDSALD